MKQTDDLRIAATKELVSPAQIHEQFPLTETSASTTALARQEIQAVMDGADDRVVVIVGPCSIHDPKSALEYADRLAKLKSELADDLVIIMRVYFEKPRTTVGWKGLINDPDLNDSYNVNKGLGIARDLLLSINDMAETCKLQLMRLVQQVTRITFCLLLKKAVPLFLIVPVINLLILFYVVALISRITQRNTCKSQLSF